jgi:hypothetical protein
MVTPVCRLRGNGATARRCLHPVIRKQLERETWQPIWSSGMPREALVDEANKTHCQWVWAAAFDQTGRRPVDPNGKSHKAANNSRHSDRADLDCLIKELEDLT